MVNEDGQYLDEQGAADKVEVIDVASDSAAESDDEDYW